MALLPLKWPNFWDLNQFPFFSLSFRNLVFYLYSLSKEFVSCQGLDYLVTLLVIFGNDPETQCLKNPKNVSLEFYNFGIFVFKKPRN